MGVASAKKLGYGIALSGVLFGVALAAACSSDDPARISLADAGPNDAGIATTPDAPVDAATRSPASWRSGSRLRAEVVRAGDAARFDRFFDTHRNEVCSFQATSPGEYHCLPSAMNVAYAEATCETPTMAIVRTCTKAIEYATTSATITAGCDSHHLVRKVFAVGPAIGEGDTYDTVVTGTCALVERSPEDGSVRHALGPEVPLTEFVKATSSRVSVSPDLSVERLVGEDGSELSREAFFDHTRDAGCTVAIVGPPNARSGACIPERAAHADTENDTFANASCTEAAARGVSQPGCAADGVALLHSRVDAGGGCRAAFVSAIHERGALLATLYEGPSCTPVAAEPGAAMFALGPELSPSVFPAIDEQVFGTARVGLRALANSGVRLTNGTLYDSTAKSYCVPSMFSDGKLYCLPSNVVTYGFKDRYKDPACTQPIYLSVRCSPATALVEVVDYGCTGNLYDANVLPLSPPFELPTYYEKTATCDAKTNDIGLAHDVLAPAPAATQLFELSRARE